MTPDAILNAQHFKIENCDEKEKNERKEKKNETKRHMTPSNKPSA